MSVPIYERTTSKAEYVWQARQLAVRVGEMVNNKSKKYKNNYSDKIITLSLDIITSVTTANETYVKFQSDYEIRRKNLIEAKGKLISLSTIIDIFLEQIKKSPEVTPDKFRERNAKLGKQQIEIGGMINKCVDLVTGVLKSDEERFSKIKEGL